MTWLLHVASGSTRQKHTSHPKGQAGCSWEWPLHTLPGRILAELLAGKQVVPELQLCVWLREAPWGCGFLPGVKKAMKTKLLESHGRSGSEQGW